MTTFTDLTTELVRLAECARANAVTAKENPEAYVAAVADHFMQLIPMVADVRKALALTEQQKADRDALLYGNGFMRAGKHIPAEEVVIVTSPQPAHPATPVPQPAGSPRWTAKQKREAFNWLQEFAHSPGSTLLAQVALDEWHALATAAYPQGPGDDRAQPSKEGPPAQEVSLDATGASQEPMRVFSIDGEDYAYEDFGQLLDQLDSIGELFVGREYSVGTGVPVTPASLSADLANCVDDYLTDILCDRVGEYGEDALEEIDPDDFAKAVEPLIAKAFTGRCWCVEDSEDHTITAEDIALRTTAPSREGGGA